MGDKRPKFDSDEHTPIQLDIFGIKAKISPVADEVQPPRTWQEVGRRINRHLMALVEAPFGVPAVVVTGVNNLVRGVGAIFTRRVEDAHVEADRREDSRQHALIEREAKSGPLLPDKHEVGTVMEQLADLLNEFRAQGLAVEIRDLGNGRVGVYLLPPEQLDAAFEIVEQHVLPDLDAAERPVLERSITDFELTVRTRKAMRHLGLNTFSDLVQKSANELLAAPGFGEVSLNEVRELLSQLGLSLRDE